MLVRSFFITLLLAAPLYGYAEDAQPDSDLLEFLAGLEIVDGELLDPMEIDDMFETRTIRESDNE